MRILAYCSEVARSPVRAAVGVEPLTSPPCRSGGQSTDWTGYDLVYVRLHGREDTPDVWFGQGLDGRFVSALTIDDIRTASGIWLLANCYAAESPWPQALYRAGADVVIAGGGINYAANTSVVGADLLARWLRYGLVLGLSAEHGLKLAKARLWMTKNRALSKGHPVPLKDDTLAFSIRPKEV